MSKKLGCKDSLMKEFEEYVQTIKDTNDKSIVVPLLQKMQNTFGYIPEKAVMYASRELGIASSAIYGVATFYTQFTLEPKGKYVINICLGTACYVKGAAQILDKVEQTVGIKNGQTSPDMKFSIDTQRCIGACGLAPVMIINGKVYGKVKVEEVESIIEHYVKANEV